MEKKRCSDCKLEKPLKDFARNRSKPDGLHNKCRACKKIYNIAYYKRTKERHNPGRVARRKQHRAELQREIYEYLKSHPCVDCGEKDIVVLEFDHQRDKSANISQMLMDGKNWSQIMVEIEKCEVVCANDHRRRTAEMFGSYKLTLANSEAEYPALNGGVGMSEFPRGTNIRPV